MSAKAGLAMIGAEVVGEQKKGAARAQTREAERIHARLRQIAEATPQEREAIKAQLADQKLAIARERKLLESVDPAIMEAGKQAYQLMQGKEAAVLGPVKRQRERQRAQLREMLRRQLGPGYENSSAGIEALNRFDIETSDMLAMTQQNVIGQFLGTAQFGAQMGRQTELGVFAARKGTLGTLNDIRRRQLEAEGTAAGYTFGTAGMQQLAQAQKSAAMFQIGGQAIEEAESFAMAAGTGGASAAGGTSFESIAQGAGGTPSPSGEGTEMPAQYDFRQQSGQMYS